MMEPSAPPEYPGYDNKSQKINTLFNKYEISSLFREKLEKLQDFKIVFIIDDSGSMNTPIDDGGPHATRWEELKDVVKTAIDIGSIYNTLDINFLNRDGLMNVSDFSQISYYFDSSPSGRTPLTKALNSVIQRYNNSNQPILLVIATDGVPDNLESFKNTLLNKNHSKFFVSFLACSDNESEIGYLNELDNTIPNIDTLDDYLSEKKEVINAQGNLFSYTYADHIVRLLLGPICPELDKLDEKPKSTNKCCIIL